MLIHWINTRKVRIKVRRGDESVELSTGNVKDAERLIAKLKAKWRVERTMVTEQPDVRWQALLVGVASNAHSENLASCNRSTARRNSRARSSGTCPDYARTT